ncbi:MAG: hypothetical protein EXS36_14905 [Pedosphaera sp.]|nr:hypothetical protein [Pedosphaera sp.]
MTIKPANPPPTALQAPLNGGLMERSRITSLPLLFNKNVSSSLTTGDIILRNLTTSAAITADKLALTYNSSTNQANLTFPGLLNQRLPDGLYRLRISAASVVAVDGKPLDQDFILDFHVLTGDANGDRITNDLDLYRVWQNQRKSVAARDLNNDLNGDGQFTSADLDVVRGNYLGRLPTIGRLNSDVTKNGVINEFDHLAVWLDLLGPGSARNLAHDLNGDGQATEEDLALVSGHLRSLGLRLNSFLGQPKAVVPTLSPSWNRVIKPLR